MAENADGLREKTPIRFKGFTMGKIDNIALATPDAPQMGGVSNAGQTFVLFDKADDEWLVWRPKIALAK